MYLDLQVRCICLILNKSGFSQQIFMKFVGNPSRWGHADTCGQPDKPTDRGP
jgi:hypothetical protein